MKRSAAFLAVGLVLAACSQSAGGGAAASPPEPTPPPIPALDPVGVYDYTTEVEGMAMTGTMTITGSPGAYSGSVSSDMGTIVLRDIAVDGQELTFVGDTPDFTVFFVLDFVRDTFTGEWDAEGMVGFISGTKR